MGRRHEKTKKKLAFTSVDDFYAKAVQKPIKAVKNRINYVTFKNNLNFVWGKIKTNVFEIFKSKIEIFDKVNRRGNLSAKTPVSRTWLL